MRLSFTPVLALLAACGEREEVDSPSDTGDSSGHRDEDTDRETGAGGRDTSDTSTPSDTGCAAVSLQSDNAVSSSGCVEVIAICAAGSCTLDVHLDTLTISGTIANADPGSDWRILFEDPTLDLDLDEINQLQGSWYGTDVPFGTVAASANVPSYNARVFPGVYNLALEMKVGSDVTQHFPVATDYVLSGDTTFDIDLPFRTVSGVVRLNGGDFTPGSSTLLFEDASTGAYARVDVANDDATYNVMLPDGAYDVTVEAKTVTGIVEGDHDVGTVEVAGAAVNVDFDIEAYTVGGSVLLGGAPLPELSVDSSWMIAFVDEGGRRMDTYVHEGDTWSVLLPSGTWDVWLPYQYLMATGIVVSGPTTADLAEETVEIGGSFLVDGRPPIGWSLVFHDPENSVEYYVDGLDWSALVHPGVYDVYIEGDSGKKLIEESVAIATSASMDYAVTTVVISGTVSWNGSMPPEDWAVTFVDTASGAKNTFMAENRSSLNWEGRLLPGVYDIYVQNDVYGMAMYVPLVRGFSISDDSCLDLEVNTYSVGGTVLLDGVLPGGEDYQWSIIWNNEATGDTLMEHFDDGVPIWSVDLPAGVYTFLASFYVLQEEGTSHRFPVYTCVEIGPS